MQEREQVNTMHTLLSIIGKLMSGSSFGAKVVLNEFVLTCTKAMAVHLPSS